ncbi:hypothetical protein M1555_02170, partial [Patescibacteria group bacterium]|nr:hypothetical protein [Patescibacteria group bacterium]
PVSSFGFLRKSNGDPVSFNGRPFLITTETGPLLYKRYQIDDRTERRVLETIEGTVAPFHPYIGPNFFIEEFLPPETHPALERFAERGDWDNVNYACQILAYVFSELAKRDVALGDTHCLDEIRIGPDGYPRVVDFGHAFFLSRKIPRWVYQWVDWRDSGLLKQIGRNLKNTTLEHDGRHQTVVAIGTTMLYEYFSSGDVIPAFTDAYISYFT